MTFFFNYNNLFNFKIKDVKRPIYIYNKNLVILDEYVSNKFKVYNGFNFTEIIISAEMVGCKFGEFVNSRKIHKYVKKKKKK